MKRLIVLATALSSVAACQSTYGGGCPPLVAYSADQMKRAAAEMRALHKEAELRRLVTDYGKMRDSCRVVK